MFCAHHLPHLSFRTSSHITFIPNIRHRSQNRNHINKNTSCTKQHDYVVIVEKTLEKTIKRCGNMSNNYFSSEIIELDSEDSAGQVICVITILLMLLIIVKKHISDSEHM